MKKAREYFEKDRVNKKQICKVVISGDTANKNIKYCKTYKR